jgi:hypothetical protein
MSYPGRTPNPLGRLRKPATCFGTLEGWLCGCVTRKYEFSPIARGDAHLTFFHVVRSDSCSLSLRRKVKA